MKRKQSMICKSSISFDYMLRTRPTRWRRRQRQLLTMRNTLNRVEQMPATILWRDLRRRGGIRVQSGIIKSQIFDIGKQSDGERDLVGGDGGGGVWWLSGWMIRSGSGLFDLFRLGDKIYRLRWLQFGIWIMKQWVRWAGDPGPNGAEICDKM